MGALLWLPHAHPSPEGLRLLRRQSTYVTHRDMSYQTPNPAELCPAAFAVPSPPATDTQSYVDAASSCTNADFNSATLMTPAGNAQLWPKGDISSCAKDAPSLGKVCRDHPPSASSAALQQPLPHLPSQTPGCEMPSPL